MALEEVVGQIVAWKDVCARVLNQLQGTDLRFLSAQQLEQVRGEVLIWERALDRAVLALTSLAKLHIKEEIIRLQEVTAQKLIAALDAAVKASAVGPDDRKVIYLEYAKRLRELSAAGVVA